MRADAEEHGFKALFLEISKREVLAEFRIMANFHAERFDRFDFCPDDLARQTVFGYAEHQHSAGDVVRLENGWRETHQRQLVRAGQSCRTGADDRDFAIAADPLAARIAKFRINPVEVEAVGLDAVFFADETLQRADGNGGIQCAAATLRLARRRANPAADRGERIGRARDNVSIFVPAFGNRLHITAGIRAHRASLAAKHLPREIIHIRQFD